MFIRVNLHESTDRQGLQEEGECLSAVREMRTSFLKEIPVLLILSQAPPNRAARRGNRLGDGLRRRRAAAAAAAAQEQADDEAEPSDEEADEEEVSLSIL